MRFRRVQTLVREGNPLVKLRNSALELVRDAAVGRMLPVLDLDPVRTSATAVDALAVLADQTFKPHAARSLEQLIRRIPPDDRITPPATARGQATS